MDNTNIIVGDFNVDDKRLDTNFAYSNYFDNIDDMFSEFGIIQLIEFTTWSQFANNVLKSSILDQMCVRDATVISSICSCKQ